MAEQQTSSPEDHQARDLDDVIDALLALVEARAHQLGCRTWADLVDRAHPGHLEAQQRATTAANATSVALWALGFELHAGYVGPAAELAGMLDDFTDRMHATWHRGYTAGFDGHPWDTSDTVGFDDDHVDTAPAPAAGDGHVDVTDQVERVDVRGDFL